MGWQDAVAITVVFGAALYLSSLGWKGLIGGRSRGCGSSCGKCSSDAEQVHDGAAVRPDQLVSIGLPRVAPTEQPAARRSDHSEIA